MGAHTLKTTGPSTGRFPRQSPQGPQGPQDPQPLQDPQGPQGPQPSARRAAQPSAGPVGPAGRGDRAGLATSERLLFPVTVVLIVLAALAWLVRTGLHRAVAETFADSPLSGVAEFVAEDGLYVVVAVAALTGVWTLLRDRPAFLRLVCGGVGVVLAYLCSELVKAVVREGRPCAAGDVATVLTCPTGGDWSWPSNHSVIAAAFATACILALPRARGLVALVSVLAALEAFSRVAAGVHYPHDVLSGLALGIAVVTVVAGVLTPVVRSLVDRTGVGRRFLGDGAYE